MPFNNDIFIGRYFCIPMKLDNECLKKFGNISFEVLQRKATETNETNRMISTLEYIYKINDDTESNNMIPIGLLLVNTTDTVIHDTRSAA